MRFANSVLVLFVFLLAACGGNSTPTSAPPAPTTDTSSGNPNASAPTLSETYTSTDGRWTVQYPAGWVVNDVIANILLLASSSDVANKAFTGAAYHPGEVSVQLTLNTISGDPAPAEHVASFAGSIGIPLGEASETTIGGRSAGRVDGSNDNRHLMAVDIVSGENYIDALTYTNPGEFAAMEPTLLAMLETVQYE